MKKTTDSQENVSLLLAAADRYPTTVQLAPKELLTIWICINKQKLKQVPKVNL